MLRRKFLKSIGTTLIACASKELWADSISIKKSIDWSNGILPLYCLAYIDPLNEKHKNQETFISKYSISVIPQDARPRYKLFREKLKNLNPTQKILAYQMTLDENGLRGPGHELLRGVRNSWLTLPGGIVPTINIPSGNVLKRRIFDPRIPQFRDKFVKACELLVHQHGFDGIFFDNCTIYGFLYSIPVLGHELLDALHELISDVRNALPNALLIGNSRYSINGLNGEMNEGRPSELVEEAKPINGHSRPYINMYHHYMKSLDEKNILFAEKQFRIALENKCFFGTGINAQTIRWYDFFDRVLSEYEVI